jgi:hypothetical protein
VIVGVPVAAFLLFRLKLETYCPPSEKWAGCDYTRLILLILAALGTVALFTLLWWGISKLAGLRGIFEIPWFGVGDDVESASMLESVLRAAIFVVAVWLIIAAVAAPFAMVHFSDIWIHATKKETPDAPPPNTGLSPTPGVSAEASILAELKGVNSNLVVMQGLLPKQEQWLAALNQVKPNLAGIEGLLTQQEQSLGAIKTVVVGQEPLVRAIKDTLVRQEQRLAVLGQIEPGMAGIKDALARQTQRLGALDQIQDKLRAWDPNKDLSSDSAITSILDRTRQTNAALEAVLTQLSEHGRQLIILEKIHQVFVDGRGHTQSNGCFDYVTAVGPDSRAGAVSASATVGTPERYRTVAVRPVFFDRGSRSLSDWARQDLAWFLGETQITDGKLAIYGSTDPQGTATLNGVLARQRVEAIRSYVLEDAKLRGVPPLEIISVRPSSDAGAPKSEPYKRVASIRLLQPCP